MSRQLEGACEALEDGLAVWAGISQEGLQHTGDVTAGIEAEYELLFTQRLILQPRIELNAAFQNVEALGLGAGQSLAEAHLRPRYEIRREVAPYVGISRKQACGGAAEIAKDAGVRLAGTWAVAGLRFSHQGT